MLKTQTVTVSRVVMAIAFLMVVLPVTACIAQPGIDRPTEIAFEVESMTLQKLETPIVTGYGKTAERHQEALVFSMEVSDEDLQSLPPSAQPVIYVGKTLVPVMGTRPGQEKGRILLDGYCFDWDALEEGGPIVVTISEEPPLLESGQFRREDFPQFKLSDVVDQR